jgi:hypothetical protein
MSAQPANKEEYVVVGTVVYRERKDGFSVYIPDGYYEGDVFFVPHDGPHPEPSEMIEIRIDDANNVIDWKRFNATSASEPRVLASYLAIPKG